MRLIKPPTQDSIDALTAPLRLWMLRFVAALAEILGDHLTGAWKLYLRREVRDAERTVEILVYLMARRRIAFVDRALRPRRPSSARLVAIRGSLVRRLTQSGFAGVRAGTLSQRVKRVLCVLADPERAIARMLKRLARIARAMRMLVCADPLMLAGAIAHAAPDCADSS